MEEDILSVVAGNLMQTKFGRGGAGQHVVHPCSLSYCGIRVVLQTLDFLEGLGHPATIERAQVMRAIAFIL
jgi:hypothetical protein